MIETVNGHVLFPFLPNMQELVRWQRGWQTQVSLTLDGAERRRSMRQHARQSITFLITPTTLAERNDLDTRLDEAVKTGLGCSPLWGKGTLLTAEVDGDTVELEHMSFDWRAGDWVFLYYALIGYDARQVQSVLGNVLTLTEGAHTYPEGLVVWPLVFGKFSMDRQDAITNEVGEVHITIGELVSRKQGTLGDAPAPGEGIGSMIVNDTFEVGAP
jgi:hypothetical protein